MKRRNQGCALSACGEVTASKIVDNIEHEQLSQHGRRSKLKTQTLTGPMTYGLSMNTNGANGARAGRSQTLDDGGNGPHQGLTGGGDLQQRV
jgi:hypothetical protein